MSTTKPPKFLIDEVRGVDLTPWTDILPKNYTILGASLCLDLFLADESGAVYMLEISAGSISQIASSEDEFRKSCILDDEGWLLRPLVEACWEAGMRPNPSQCYAFTTLPLFGGEYSVSNMWLCSWLEWISFCGDIYNQTKHLPDGTTIKLDFVG